MCLPGLGICEPRPLRHEPALLFYAGRLTFYASPLMQHEPRLRQCEPGLMFYAGPLRIIQPRLRFSQSRLAPHECGPRAARGRPAPSVLQRALVSP